ncbi:MFS transporter [Lunatimonas lonarensis]|uniref:MFS transporter n=1 Tax=Lunatimonas lonarensis TaxID=1232681 RepID=UPI000563EC49|nr:MFS transporter [Lunatimonas lonarensis]
MNLLQRRRLAVSGLFFITGLCFSSWASRIPDFQDYFRLSEGQLGTLLLGMPAGSLIALPLAAWAVYRFGSKGVILAGASMYLVGLVSLGLAESRFQLAFLVVLFGLLGNIMNISLNTQALAVEKAYGRNILSSFHGSWSLAGFAGAGLGALMVFFQLSPVQHYLVIGVLGFALLAFARPYILPDGTGKSATEGGFVFKKPDSLIFRIGLVGFCGMMCEGCMFDWSGVYIAKVVNPHPSLVAFGFFAFMGAMASGRFLADRFANKIGKIGVLRASGILIFAGLCLAVLFPNLSLTLLGFALVGLGTAAVVPLSYSIVGRSTTYPPGIAIAMVSTISFFGFLLGPPIIGFIAELLNLQSSFAIISLMGLSIAVLVSIRQEVFVTANE